MSNFDFFNTNALVSLIRDTLLGALAHWESERSRFQDTRIGYTEAEAAALLGLEKHVLRDARLRGEISARKVGKQYVYERGDLIKFVSVDREGRPR